MQISEKIKQRTIKSEIEFSGITLHKGNKVNIRLEPAPENYGIEFIRNDLETENRIKLDCLNVLNTTMATVIGTEKFQISTTEHLLSPIYAMGIDNLKIYIDSNELPVLDGSSLNFLEKLEEAGIKIQNQNKKVLRILKKIEVRDEKDFNRFVSITPHQSEENLNTLFNYTIDFKHKVIGVQSCSVNLKIDDHLEYREKIAPARTFGFLSEVEYLRANNLALGANYDNVIVIGDDEVLNEQGLRFENEFVRHKVLDAIGDMSFINARFIGEYNAFAGSHYLNNLLIRKLFEDKSNYEIIEL